MNLEKRYCLLMSVLLGSLGLTCSLLGIQTTNWPTEISHPKPFEYVITPRDDRATALIHSVLEDYPFDKGDADVLESL